MSNLDGLVRIPDNGNTWLHDAAIETSVFLDATIGNDIIDKMEPLPGEELPEWDGGKECELHFVHYAERAEGRRYIPAHRDNVYNHENDVSDVFTFTIYAPEDATEWYYATDVYVATCRHRGGDVRGNYAMPELRRGDILAETGFLDWMLGWSVNDPNIDDEPYSPGYSSCPVSEVEKDFGDSGHWFNGEFVFVNQDDEPTGIRVAPYSYAGNY